MCESINLTYEYKLWNFKRNVWKGDKTILSGTSMLPLFTFMHKYMEADQTGKIKHNESLQKKERKDFA